MEALSEIQSLLEQIPQPAFLVKDGTITHLNHAAQMHQLNTGTSVTKLICTGDLEYNDFQSGRLMLNLTIEQCVYPATVVRTGNYDIFYLESEYQTSELQTLALAAQNLRTPLAGAMLNMDKLLQDTEIQASADLTQQISKLNRNLHQLLRLVGNMSDAATYGQSHIQHAETLDAVAFISEVVEKATALTAKSQRKIVFHSLNKPVYCAIDSDKLERALLNLISNAIKNSPNESEILITLQQGLNKLYLSVQNTLIGQQADLQKNIFSRFTREPSLDGNNSGIGLGLTIVRSAASAHNGTVLVETPENNSFRVTMSISLKQINGMLRAPVTPPTDFCGGYDRTLIELSEILPAELFK